MPGGVGGARPSRRPLSRLEQNRPSRPGAIAQNQMAATSPNQPAQRCDFIMFLPITNCMICDVPSYSRKMRTSR
mgnify:CR=1 FL=1|jgi:hypothetical protein